MTTNGEYKYLGPRQGSNYRQFFIKGRNTRAETIYGYTLDSEALTPEQIAEECDLPVEAVHECIDYCKKNASLLDEERDREWANIRAMGWDRPPHAPEVVSQSDNSR